MRPTPRPACLLLLAALVCGCGEVAETVTGSPAPAVEYYGCRRAFAGPVCMLYDHRRLTLWIAAPARSRVTIEADGRPLASPGVEVRLGLRYRLDIPADSHRLVVRVEDSDPWELALLPPDGSTWWDETSSHLMAGELDAARAVVEEAERRGAAEAGRALSARARIARFAGETRQARELLQRAIRAHRERGEHLQETYDAAALYDLLAVDDLAAARQVLAAVPHDWQGPAEAAYLAAYIRALLANDTGDLGTALRLLSAAFEQADRLGLAKRRLEAGQVLARQLQELGRGGEASSLLHRLIDGMRESTHPCRRGQFLTNAAWISLLALEAGESAEDPTGLLHQALEIFEQGCPQLPDERLNVKLNLALAHLHAGHLREARQRLRQTREPGAASDPRLRLWQLEIEGRIALAAARPGDALRAWDELAELAAAGFSPEARWRAALGRARALVALGRRPAALEALAEAEQRLDEATLMVPLTEGRGTFVKQREAGIRLYLDLLLEAGREAEALAVARRSRSRVLRGLLRQGRLAELAPAEQQRWDGAVTAYRARRAELDAEAAGDWQLPQDRRRRRVAARDAAHQELLRGLDDALTALDRRSPEPGRLPPLASGELALVYHPLAAGWVGFAHDAAGLVARRLACEVEDLAPERLGECLLAPFADRIARAQRLRVLPYGALRQVDFHALPLGGDALLAARPVVYGLDLDRLAEAPPSGHGPRAALLIADPAGDLPAARREADAVAAALAAPAGGFRVHTLRGTAAAGATVRELLPRADLLHYSGHAVFEGLAGWESALPLADGSRLTVGDVLALEGSPRWVVLSGCETGRTSPRVAAESVSLAHAFVVAGAESVVAATRPVADAAAYRLVAAFYREWSGGATAAAALRRAQLRLRRDDPEADWAAFRLIAP